MTLSPLLRHRVLTFANSTGRSQTAGRRAPFGWPTMTIGPEDDLTLKWPPLDGRTTPQLSEPGWLCLTTATDDREEKIISARLGESRVAVGEFYLRQAPALSSCRLRLPEHALPRAYQMGITLTLTRGNHPLQWFAPNVPSEATALAPHLLPNQRTAPHLEFFNQLASIASVQPFGWMEGCVLDALHDLAETTGEARFTVALQAHLAAFFSSEAKLIYENARGEISDNIISSIESTLPFAVLAKVNPIHPSLALALNFWQSRRRYTGAIQDDDVLSAEDSYTVAYPLAVIGAHREDCALIETAAAQLRLRREKLRSQNALALRCSDRGELTFRNWTRGCAWYFLGLVRTLESLLGRTETKDLEEEVRAMAGFVREYQRADGLWGAFLDSNTDSADTSGSAGLATALARGARAGWLSADDRAAALRTWRGLQSHLALDGFLTDVAPVNRGGERLQRSGYRVISAMGMGLMGQLAAALGGETDIQQNFFVSDDDRNSRGN